MGASIIWIRDRAGVYMATGYSIVRDDTKRFAKWQLRFDDGRAPRNFGDLKTAKAEAARLAGDAS